MAGKLNASSDFSGGSAVQIVSIEDGKFILNEDNLKSIFLDTAVKENKVCIFDLVLRISNTLDLLLLAPDSIRKKICLPNSL
jgi:hypothetical protein